MPRTTSFIDGAFLPAGGSGAVAELIDPCTGDVVAAVQAASPDDVERAVTVARRVFDDGHWPGLPPVERGEILRRVAAGILAREDDFATLEAVNAGKPIAAARREVAGAARVFGYYAGAMDKFFGETVPQGDGNITFTLREALGVVAQITPWNFPLLAASWKLAPALAAGCAAILKPSPLTPLSTLLLAEVMAEAGVPPGAAQIVLGGAVTGRALVEHAGVDGISFTGSTEVGREVMRAASAGIKRVALELGGKNATVVFADADLDRAARSAVGAAFGNAGQSCSARSRILVERPVAGAFAEALAAATATLRPGPTLDPTTTLGPLISAEHWSRVDRHVHDAAAAGARLVCGGGRPDGAPANGQFHAATIFADVTPEMALWRREVFGPVCGITAFDGEDEAVRLANDSAYGLNGSVWSRDIGHALRVARRVRTGSIAVNGLPSASATGVFAPFGGYKQSGLGRELGMQALAAYTEIKTVFVDLART